jgi:glycosyltransferase involved in cell wall biosynthesis
VQGLPKKQNPDMRWLIVEDALKNRTGHWLEWVTTFDRGLRELGDEVTVLADREVEDDIRDSLRAEAILPRSIWHRLGDGAGPLTRYSRVVTHNWQTGRVMDHYLRNRTGFDAIFVPTVSVHHLLAWTRLIKHTLRGRKTRVLLFFLTAPVKNGLAGTPIPDGSPTGRLLRATLGWLAPEIRTGKVVLGVETKAMQCAFETLSGLPFVWFPQPVAPPVREARPHGEQIKMACFGAARAEKGSDVLQEAIRLYLREKRGSRAHFTIQWIDNFTAGGRLITKAADLETDSRVNFVTRYFREGEYAKHLQQTDVMLLPYRLDSYALRGSRVVIEAAVNGIPVIVTSGTTLASIAEAFRTGIECKDGNPQSLAEAIGQMEQGFEEMSEQARRMKSTAVDLFSVKQFRRIFLASATGTNAEPTAKPMGNGAVEPSKEGATHEF